MPLLLAILSRNENKNRGKIKEKARTQSLEFAIIDNLVE